MRGVEVRTTWIDDPQATLGRRRAAVRVTAVVRHPVWVWLGLWLYHSGDLISGFREPTPEGLGGGVVAIVEHQCGDSVSSGGAWMGVVKGSTYGRGNQWIFSNDCVCGRRNSRT